MTSHVVTSGGKISIKKKANREKKNGVATSRRKISTDGGPATSKVKDDSILETSLVDPMWELIDPTPDIHALFLQFNDLFFFGTLSGCEVKWSPRMTLCAGVCSYEGRGGLCSIRLSKPLLTLRPRKDLVETLLHEMIHAYLFVTVRNRDRDGHGPEFQLHMNRINARAGTRITIYHSFHAEVAVYKTHWWRCDGPCRNRRPFFGFVKRASNRAPGPNDYWWAEHQSSCSGTFVKIKEPEGYQKDKKKSSEAKQGLHNTDILSVRRTPSPQKTITSFFPGTGYVLGGASTTKSGPSGVKRKRADAVGTEQTHSPQKMITTYFPGTGYVLGGASASLSDPLPSQGSPGSRKEKASSAGDPSQRVSPPKKSAQSSITSFFAGEGSLLGGASAGKKIPSDKTVSLSAVEAGTFCGSVSASGDGQKDGEEMNSQKSQTDFDVWDEDIVILDILCPVCRVAIPESVINAHLDSCLVKK